MFSYNFDSPPEVFCPNIERCAFDTKAKYFLKRSLWCEHTIAKNMISKTESSLASIWIESSTYSLQNVQNSMSRKCFLVLEYQ